MFSPRSEFAQSLHAFLIKDLVVVFCFCALSGEYAPRECGLGIPLVQKGQFGLSKILDEALSKMRGV